MHSETHEHNDEGVLNYVSGWRESVVENSLLMRQILMTIRLHEELFQRKGIITTEKWNVWSVTKKGFRLREVKPVSGYPKLQLAVVPYLGITHYPIDANVQPDKFIVCINNSHYDDGMELLVVVKIRASMG